LLQVVRSTRPETGGIAEFARQIGPALTALGCVSRVVSLDPPAGAGPEATALGRSYFGYGRAPRFPAWLREHAREYDAVIVHGLWLYHGWATRQALRGSGTPYLVYCHGMLDPWFRRRYPVKHLKKWLYWMGAECRVLRDAAAVCFTCEEERRLAHRTFRLRGIRERVVPIGTAAPPPAAARQRAEFFRRFPELERRPFLLFLGRVDPKKGLDDLFAAWRASAAAREFDLVIAGPGLDAAYYRRITAEAPREVRWLGMVEGELKWGALRACAALILPSHQENFGIVVVEALACGRPVLISRQVNIWREVEADGAGFSAPDTVAGAAELLERWRSLAPEARAALGAAATASFHRRFEIGSAAAALIEAVSALPAP
jgi:glycosyltransferase involved in cell wall biosynthesis